MTSRRTIVALLALGAVVATSAPAAAYPRPGSIAAMSVAASGEVGTGGSANPAISGDGRWVTFMSEAPDLVPGDANSSIDVFLHDRQMRSTSLISRSTGGGPGNSHSLDPAISLDGRWITFLSYATDLVPNDTTGAPDIFVFDRDTGAMDRASFSSAGAQANGPSSYPSISSDGRFVAFASRATNLVPGDTNALDDVFVRDRTEGTTERVSVSGTGGQGDGHSNFGRISADGTAVAFQSYASNLVPGDTNGVFDIFVRDRPQTSTERASVSTGGGQGSSSSSYPSVSADGRIVTFYSYAADLVPADGNAAPDAFVRDRAAAATRRVSVNSEGGEASGSSAFPAVSADGRFVAFESTAPNLAAGDSNGSYDVFVHDVLDGSTELVSRGKEGPGNGESSWPSISRDGRHVAFHSAASNLAGPDGNARYDIYARDRGPVLGTGRVVAERNEGKVRFSGWASFSGVPAASANDPSDDGGPGAAQSGGELTGAMLVHRPEIGDLLIRLSVAGLPGVRGGFSQVGILALGRPPVAGAPAVVYGLAFEAGGTRYEVRALRAAASAVPPSAPFFGLYRCETVCTETARLSGSIGGTGNEIAVAFPLPLIGDPASLSEARAFTAAGEAAPGRVALMDEVSLGGANLSRPRVETAVGAGSTPPANWIPASLTDGGFAVEVDPPATADPAAWIRACLAEDCAVAGPIEVR